MRQSPHFIFVNLVEQAFVGKASDLNDLVPWLSDFQFCDYRHSGGMIGNLLSVYI